MSYKIDKTYVLSAGEGDNRKALPYFIIPHSTGNKTSTGYGEASYMKRNVKNYGVYSHYVVGDGGKVYLVGELGYVSWTVANANTHAPVQIELQETTNKEMFKKNYEVYIELIRDSCDKYNIPKTLDTAGKYTKGVKTHYWCTYNWGGTDHVDPYPYLKLMGISKEQFAKDIANGIGNSVSNVNVENKEEIDLMDRGQIEFIAFSDTTDKETLARVEEYFKVAKMPVILIHKNKPFNFKGVKRLFVVDNTIKGYSNYPTQWILIKNMNDANKFYNTQNNWKSMTYNRMPK